MRSAEGLVVLKGFVLIFSVLIFSVLIFFRMDPVLPTRSEFMFLQNTQENDLCFNSALKCGSSKRMPFEAGDASRNRGQLGCRCRRRCRLRGILSSCKRL